jgi:hypothetical protein
MLLQRDKCFYMCHHTKKSRVIIFARNEILVQEYSKPNILKRWRQHVKSLREGLAPLKKHE